MQAVGVSGPWYFRHPPPSEGNLIAELFPLHSQIRTLPELRGWGLLRLGAKCIGPSSGVLRIAEDSASSG